MFDMSRILIVVPVDVLLFKESGEIFIVRRFSVIELNLQLRLFNDVFELSN